MNFKDLTTNKGLLAIILGVAAVAAAGGLTAIYAATDSSQTQNQTKPDIQGSINLQENIMSSVKTSFSTAQNTAESAVTNGKVIGGSLTVIQGSVVYQFKVVDDKNLFHSVIVDAGNGAVLYTSEGRSMDFGGFGMGGHCPMGGHHGWGSKQAPSSTDSSGESTSPTNDELDSLTESHV
jgi:uncharacterized membrane protein YkoI